MCASVTGNPTCTRLPIPCALWSAQSQEIAPSVTSMKARQLAERCAPAYRPGGNPNEHKYFDYMMSYSPINNVREGATYPAMLIVSGLNDPRVAYWEPTKWAQVLRANIANGDDVLLKMDLAAGHFSAADRYRYLRERAFDYAWLLEQLGKASGEADRCEP